MERNRAVREMGSAAVFLGLALVMWFYLIPEGVTAQSAFAADTGVSSRTFPYVTAALIGGLSVVQFIVGLTRLALTRKKDGRRGSSEWYLTGEIRSALVFVLFVAFVVVFRYVGTIPAMIIVPPFILFVMGSRSWAHYLSVYGFMAAMYLVFRYVLRVYLR